MSGLCYLAESSTADGDCTLPSGGRTAAFEAWVTGPGRPRSYLVACTRAGARPSTGSTPMTMSQTVHSPFTELAPCQPSGIAALQAGTRVNIPENAVAKLWTSRGRMCPLAKGCAPMPTGDRISPYTCQFEARCTHCGVICAAAGQDENFAIDYINTTLAPRPLPHCGQYRAFGRAVGIPKALSVMLLRRSPSRQPSMQHAVRTGSR